MDFAIRAAAVGDAAAIAAVRVQSWRETYAHLLSAELLAGLDPAADVAMWQASIERGARIAVADVDGQVRGLAAAGPSRDDDAPRELMLGLIYQHAALHGSGSGQALLEAVLGNEPAYLWIAESNPRAEAFYRRNGFERDGGRKIGPDEWENLVEIRMVR